jgi:hypothetical protein
MDPHISSIPYMMTVRLGRSFHDGIVGFAGIAELLFCQSILAG